MGTWRPRWCVSSGGETSQETSTPWPTAMQVSMKQKGPSSSSSSLVFFSVEQVWYGSLPLMNLFLIVFHIKASKHLFSIYVVNCATPTSGVKVRWALEFKAECWIGQRLVKGTAVCISYLFRYQAVDMTRQCVLKKASNCCCLDWLCKLLHVVLIYWILFFGLVLVLRSRVHVSLSPI